MKAKIPEGWIVCGWSGCLDPANDTASRFNQWYGSQRFRWNRLLDRQKVEFASTGKSPVAARVAALVAERKMGRQCGFPRPKKKFVNENGIYCVLTGN